MIYQCANAYYFSYINKIGGIESHLYYIGKKYGKYDIVLFYRDGDTTNINRIKQFIPCYKLERNDKVICDSLFCCFNREILDQCEAKHTYLVLHGDYNSMIKQGQLSKDRLPIDKRIDKYLGVSQLVCDSWKEATGIDAEFIGEPVELDKVDKPLLFVSATRLTKEKGGNRMLQLAKELNRNNVNFLWFIFTDKPQQKVEPNMIQLEPRLDLINKLAAFDAFIQLSDNEGYCLSVVEALNRKLPIICTDLPVFNELGLDDSNSIKLPLDMSVIPVNKIKKIKKLKVNYENAEDKWLDYLKLEESNYLNKSIRVKATKNYQKRRITDSELGIIPEDNFEWDISKSRLQELLKYEEKYKVKLVEVIYEMQRLF